MLRKLGKLGVFLEMIKIEHTIFALPFAFMGAIVGAYTLLDSLPSWSEIGWILVAMVGARTAAMGLNRVIDRLIDARNPRTAMRAIPAGLLGVKEVGLYIALSFGILFLAASQLDPICLYLMPIAVFFLVIYSYTKRFTWLCHIVLGLTIGLAPLGAWVAVTGEFTLTAWLLYVANVFWLAGFDIIYACQDYEFDRTNGIRSIPARFGLKRALQLAALFHIITASGLIAILWTASLGWIYAVGLIIVSGILLFEHAIVKPDNLSRLQTAFFSMNGLLSVVMFVFTFIDVAVL